VLHSVPNAPTWRRRWTLQSALARVEAVVVMSMAAKSRLLALHDVTRQKLHVIPHGAHDVGALLTGSAQHGRPLVLTWGLLRPGKGIEWGIEAMNGLTGLGPAPRYLIAGPTHTKALRQEGEAYRKQLVARVGELGLDDVVQFDDQYRDTAALGRLIRTADAVLLPFDSRDLTSSAVLSQAMAALLPVVATRFPHAVEAVGSGAGELVDHRDPAGIAAALRVALTDRDAVTRMRRAAALTAPTLHWATVAQRYRELAEALL
jgi:glycosyltransferase involved in cell wall biosynthesis